MWIALLASTQKEVESLEAERNLTQTWIHIDMVGLRSAGVCLSMCDVWWSLLENGKPFAEASRDPLLLLLLLVVVMCVMVMNRMRFTWRWRCAIIQNCRGGRWRWVRWAC